MVNAIMSAAIDSASFHVIRSSTNRNKHLSCGNIQYGPVRNRGCTKEQCKHVTLDTRPAEVHPRHKELGPVAAAAAAGPLFSLQIRIGGANANDYLPADSVAKQQFKGLLPKQRIAWPFPTEIKREQLGEKRDAFSISNELPWIIMNVLFSFLRWQEEAKAKRNKEWMVKVEKVFHNFGFQSALKKLRVS